MSTPTTVSFLAERVSHSSEVDAMVWVLDKSLGRARDLTPLRKYQGAQGAVLLDRSRDGMNQPKRLGNGWWIESCLNHDQKVVLLDQVGRSFGLKRGVDWEWQSDHMVARPFIDTDALFKELERL